MKKLYALGGVLAPALIFSQSFVSIATDVSGDDHSHNMDAAGLHYAISPNQDSLYMKFDHHHARPADFGYAIALDTNLNPADGAAVNQANLKSGSPNTDLNYDLVLYIYQNSFFPGLNIDPMTASGSLWLTSLSVDTTDPMSLVLGIPLTDLDNKLEFNLIGFTGSFDIAPGGAGPSDVIPNTGFAQIRQSGVGLAETEATYTLYPNPATNFFSLNYRGSALLVNVTGRIISEFEVEPGVPVPIKHIAPGTYFLQVGGSNLRLAISR